MQTKQTTNQPTDKQKKQKTNNHRNDNEESYNIC